MQGWGDSELTEAGREQARRHGARLKQQYVDKIFASDLGRVRETIQHIRERCDVDTVFCANLRECSMGAWEGHRLEEVIARWETEYRCWRHGDESVSAPEGESARAIETARRRGITIASNEWLFAYQVRDALVDDQSVA